MSPKLKKVIIAVVVFLLVGIGALVGVSMLTNLSTTTVFDLRLVDAESETTMFDKDVYLTALSENNFDVKISSDTSSLINYVVTSSNTAVATVSQKDEIYTITYHKAGATVISVTAAEGSTVKDSFVLTVKENIPTELTFIDNSGNPLDNNELTLYADDRDYFFKFEAEKGDINTNLNLSQLVVVDDYNKDVFEDIYIDDAASKLVIKAKQNENTTIEHITLQTKHDNALGQEVTIDSFDVVVNVKGNYISDIQLMLNEELNFDESSNIYGSGIIKEGEQKIDLVRLSKNINVVYAKLRVVYTNGEFFDVTNSPAAAAVSDSGSFTEKVTAGNYFKIFIPSSFSGSGVNIDFSYGAENVVRLTFLYLGAEGSQAYNNFASSELYKAVTENGKTYYEYVYWDYRFERDDAITDKDGKIIAFANWDPTAQGGASQED